MGLVRGAVGRTQGDTKRDLVLLVVVWVAVTALLEVATWNAFLLPAGYAHEARVSDDAFRFLVRVAIPVFAGVVSTMVVAVARFRVRGVPSEDGEPIGNPRRLTTAWLGVTSGLAVMLIIFPGLTGLAEIQGEPHADLTVRIEGARWFWTVSYPAANVSSNTELVLPAGRRVRFETTAKDVIHSVWIPAFRLKADAVPGRVSVIRATITRPGTSDDDDQLRLQCAELCGLGHATMRLTVRVLEPAAFDAWLVQQRQSAVRPAAAPPTDANTTPTTGK